MAYIGAQKNGALEEYPDCEMRPLLFNRQGPVSDFHHVPNPPLVYPVQLRSECKLHTCRCESKS